MLSRETLRLEPVKEFVRTVEAHRDGFIAWQQNRLSNGLLEGTNSLIQAREALFGAA